MEWIALLLAVLKFAAALAEDRRAQRPQREAQRRRDDYDDDMQRMERAIAMRDSGTISGLFERERREGLAAGRLEPRGDSPRVEPHGLHDAVAAPAGERGSDGDAPAGR